MLHSSQYIPPLTHSDGVFDLQGPVLLEVRTTTGSRSDLGRPKSTPQENKTAFMKFVANL